MPRSVVVNSAQAPSGNVSANIGYNQRGAAQPNSFTGNRGFNNRSFNGNPSRGRIQFQSPLKRDSGRRQSAPFRDEPEQTWSYDEEPPKYVVMQRSVNTWIAVIDPDPAYAHDPEFADAPAYVHVTPASFAHDESGNDPVNDALVLGECLELLRAARFRNRPVQRHDVPIKNHVFNGLIRASVTATAVRRLPREKPFLNHAGLIVSHKDNARGFRMFRVNVRHFEDKSVTVPPAAVHPSCRELVTGDEVRVFEYTPPNGSTWPEDRSYLLPSGCRAQTDEKTVTSEDKIIAVILPLREPGAFSADPGEKKLPNPFDHVTAAKHVPGAVRDFQDICLAANARAHEKFCEEMDQVHYTGRFTPVEGEESAVVFKTWSVDSDKVYSAHTKFWRPDAIVSVCTEASSQSEKPRKIGSGIILSVEADEARREFEVRMSVEPVKGSAEKPDEPTSDLE
ncbi:hypothetical protein AAVH_18589 [Aphelenchoides avenae]|nr:hypothetical protein AAVH_18589 [Aphelenchus avenae]